MSCYLSLFDVTNAVSFISFRIVHKRDVANRSSSERYSHTMICFDYGRHTVSKMKDTKTSVLLCSDQRKHCTLHFSADKECSSKKTARSSKWVEPGHNAMGCHLAMHCIYQECRWLYRQGTYYSRYYSIWTYWVLFFSPMFILNSNSLFVCLCKSF